MTSDPIGIFDSGIGGLTVCKEINKLLPNENIIYYGDTARFPYGIRSSETIIQYSREIIDFLISYHSKLIVIACNSSSATALEKLQKEFPIPIIGVIDTGVRAAHRKVKGDIIGVIATRATVQSEAYIKAMKIINNDIQVIQQQASLFVPLIEEGVIEHDIMKLIIIKYLDEHYLNGIRTVILGCTHFPLLKEAITKIYPDLELIDTSEAIANQVQKELYTRNLYNRDSSKRGNIRLYASDITDAMLQVKDQFFDMGNSEIHKLVLPLL